MLILGIILKKSFSQKGSRPMGQLTELLSEESNFYKNRRLHFKKMYSNVFLGKKCHILIYKIFFWWRSKRTKKLSYPNKTIHTTIERTSKKYARKSVLKESIFICWLESKHKDSRMFDGITNNWNSLDQYFRGTKYFLNSRTFVYSIWNISVQKSVFLKVVN